MKEPVKFGNYHLFQRIAVGGMAEVFQAASYGVEAFERIFALKRVLPHIAEDQEFIDMFIDEAKIAVQLAHANIGQIFELGNAEDSYFIAMEYVPGRDARALFDRARSRGASLDIEMCCHIVKEVCEALEYAHKKQNDRGEPLNIIHRDVSPQNILVSYEGEVKLIDFGIAKAAGKANKTQAGILKGKFGYMSPEQVRGKPIDRRSDLFSLAVVLYELLTLERCFQGGDDFSTLERVRKVNFRRPTVLNRSIPPELERILYRGLTRNPRDRYQSAGQFQDALQKFLYQSGSFYSRKDLARYMKDSFARELKAGQEKLNEFRTYARSNIPEARRPGSLPDMLPGRNIELDSAGPSPSSAEFHPEESTDIQSYDSIGGSDTDQEISQDVGSPAGRDISSQARTLPRDDRSDSHAMEVVEKPKTSRTAVLALVSVAAVLIGALVLVFFDGSKPPAQITISTVPSTVEIFLDGQRQYEGQTPVKLKISNPGEHKLLVSAKGYNEKEERLRLVSAQEKTLNFTLEKQPVDHTPYSGKSVRAGRHMLVLKKDGYLDFEGEISVKADTENRIPTVRLYPKTIALTLVPEPSSTQAYLLNTGTCSDGLPCAPRPLGEGTIVVRDLPNTGLNKIELKSPGHTPRTEVIPRSFEKEKTLIVTLEKASKPKADPPKRRSTNSRRRGRFGGASPDGTLQRGSLKLTAKPPARR